MQLWHLFSVIWICVVLTGTTAKQCVKTSSGEGRRCRKACVKDFDCKAPNKTCNCDGECGMSCYNMGAVCGEPDSIEHGSVTTNGVKMQSVAKYSCDTGYVIRGNRKRICRADKNWHPHPPQCERRCFRPPRIAYSYLQTLRKSFRVGASTRYQCRTGYYTNDDNRAITCLETGRWSEANFRCRQKVCRPIMPVLNGRIIYSSSYYFGSIATLRCIRGFDFQHEGRRLVCAAGHDNLHRGTWSGLSLGECVRIQCSPPLSPRNGQFMYTSLSHRNEYETEIQYSCNIGYRLDGNSSTVCDYTGSWGKQPSCFDIKCAQPPTTRPNAERSGISYARGNLLLPESTVHYQCRQNFKISGHGEVLHDITSVCQYSDEAKMSTWNPNLHAVECEEIFCDRPPSDQNHVLESVKQSYRVGETITVTCKEGYGFSRRQFVDTVTCTDSGDWDSSFTKCQDIRCPNAPNRIQHGERVHVTLTEVTYRCDENYQVPGRNLVRIWTVKCIRSFWFWKSVWATDLDRMRCQRIPCSLPSQEWHVKSYQKLKRWHWRPDILYQPSDNWYAGQEAYFRCTEGYEFDYTELKYLPVQCLGTGRWEDSLKSCVEDIKCSMPPREINNGIVTNVLRTPLLPGSIAQYRCHDGYAISYGNYYSSTLDITCTKNARSLGSRWNPIPVLVRCKEIRCDRPPNHNDYELKADKQSWGIDETVTARCKNGYEFSREHFVNTITCTSSGTWNSSFTPCREIRCDLPPNHNDYELIFNKQSWGIDETVTARCKNGYEFSRENFVDTITCTSSGTWNSSFTPCQEIRCNLPPNHNDYELISNKQSWGIDETVTARCKNGYEFSRENFVDRITCTSSGTWNSSFTPCQEIRCNLPPNHNDYELIFNKQSWGIDETVTARCKNGYEFSREHFVDTITCTSSGTWDSSFTPCQAADKNGIIPITIREGIDESDENSGNISSSGSYGHDDYSTSSLDEFNDQHDVSGTNHYQTGAIQSRSNPPPLEEPRG